MCDLRTLSVEVWPVAADEVGIWLLSGADGLRFGPIPAHQDLHSAACDLLVRHCLPSPALLHGTSWREDGTTTMHCHIAVIAIDGLVRERYGEAEPVSRLAPMLAGPPFPVHADERPRPRYLDVLMHGIRHLRFLLTTDAAARKALAPPWPQHLAPFSAVLAGMYDPES